ncbi:MAG: lysophospholipid acyltransferase family protein [Petrimonas sp.]|jgi:1-acyl-sn-glycerol-3-phosphate acyltransferase|nr:lysophospholipid acyltransferase family protein [Petrimonas sp.]
MEVRSEILNQKIRYEQSGIKDILEEIRFLTLNYLVGPLMGLSICLLEALGRIKFIHFERFPIWEEKLIIVSNHPSLLDPFILTLMGFPWMNFPWVFSGKWKQFRFSFQWFKELQDEFRLPKKLIPANVPDKRNYYDPFYMKIFNGINIPVERNGNAQNNLNTVKALENILNNGGRVLIFPEGTRTFKAIQRCAPKSRDGAELGKLKEGVALLALNSGAKVLPIWVEGTDKIYPNNLRNLRAFPRLWHKVTIKIGCPFKVQSDTRQEATLEITRALLNLEDEED